MRSARNLGRILGVRIRLLYTWSIAFVLIIATVVTQFPEAYPLWQRIILGIVASLLFFMAITIREIFLSFVAISRGIPVRSVTLFVFGGVSQTAKEATLPIVELLVASAGLLSNLIIAGLFYGNHILLVSVENLGPDHLGRSPQETEHILSKLNQKIGFTLDVGHANLTGNLWGYLRNLGKQISHVHLHDNDGKEDRHWKLGKGDLDLDRLLEWLYQIRYKGILVLEMNHLEDIEYSKALLEDRIRDL